MEAQRLITMSLGKIASSRCQRGGINLHRNLLVASVLHKARTAYMMDAYQHIIASRKQKQEEDVEKGEVVCDKPDTGSDAWVKPGAGSGHGSAMTHSQTISHGEDKENSPPVVPSAAQDKGSVMQGVENTTTETKLTEEDSSGSTECKSATSGDNSLKICPQNRASAVTCNIGKRRRSRNVESSECPSDSIVKPKKAKLDVPQDLELLSAKENMTNNSIESDITTCSVNDSSVTCRVTKSCDRSPSEPMQTESTQITSLVRIFNSGFSGLCSRNSNPESNCSSQSQPLSCATELKQESVQIPSVIALTV